MRTKIALIWTSRKQLRPASAEDSHARAPANWSWPVFEGKSDPPSIGLRTYLTAEVMSLRLSLSHLTEFLRT